MKIRLGSGSMWFGTFIVTADKHVVWNGQMGDAQCNSTKFEFSPIPSTLLTDR